MLTRDDQWVWDFWVADDGDRFHAFYLHAAKSLGDPERRHRAARIGHAVSTDLRDWDILGDVFDAGARNSFDETATWTGSVVRGHDGLWRMFYTGARFLADWPDARNVETIGVAISEDLLHWEKQPGPLVQADARWYETLGTSVWPEEVWRDPWVYHDPQDDRWHMLVTARSNHGQVDDRGVIGHAVSNDLASWTVEPPLTQPGLGFGHLEVPQLLEHSDVRTAAIIFSCSHDALSHARREEGGEGGVWLLPWPSSTSPGPNTPERITTESLYAGRIVTDRDGTIHLMAVTRQAPGGGVSDPLPLDLDARGLPRLREPLYRPTDPAPQRTAQTTERKGKAL